MSEVARGAYAIGAQAYWRAGWTNALPVHDGSYRPGKSHVPRGYTGYNGRNVSWPDLSAWTEGEEGRWNLAVRLTAMVGIDVDAHDGERGDETLRKAEAELGPLPPTYCSTSRGKGPSRIMFFRVPLDREPLLARREKVLVDTYGPNVEILHKGHRFAVAWPSVHPDTGQTYQWYGPDGEVCHVPKRSDIPELPETWLDFLAPVQPVETSVLNGALQPALPAPAGTSQLFLTPEQAAADNPSINLRTVKEATRILTEAIQAFMAPDADGRATRLLPRLALIAGHGIPAGFWTEQQARDGIEQAAIACGYVGKHGLADLRNQMERGLRDGARTPWVMQAEPDAPSLFTQAKAVAQGGRLKRALLKRSEVESLPDPVPLINGVLYRSSVVVLAGKFGTYKSFVAVDWAASLATGTSWFGHAVPERVPVIYAAAEGAYGIRRRLNAWESRGTRIPDELYLLPLSVRINRPEDIAELEEIIQETGAKVLIFDTLHASTPGVDENDSGEMGRVMDILRGFQERHGICSILPHHTGHAGERARGSSSVEDDADSTFVIKINGEDRGPENIRTLHHRKTKDGPLIKPVDLELVLVDGTGSGYTKPKDDAWSGSEARPEAPEPWEHGHATVIVQLFKVLRDQGGVAGLNKAEARHAVVERFYRGDQKRLPKSTWYSAWDRGQERVSASGDKVMTKVDMSRWTVDPVALEAMEPRV